MQSVNGGIFSRSPNGGHRRWHSWRSQTSRCEAPLERLMSKSKRLKIQASRLTLPLPPAFMSLILAWVLQGCGRSEEKDVKESLILRWKFQYVISTGSSMFLELTFSTFSLSLKPSKLPMDQTRLGFLVKIIKQICSKRWTVFALYISLHIPTNDSRDIFKVASYGWQLGYPS